MFKLEILEGGWQGFASIPYNTGKTCHPPPPNKMNLGGGGGVPYFTSIIDILTNLSPTPIFPVNI